MSSIDFSKSQALLLARDLESNFKANEEWILTFERDIQTARRNYDAENNDYACSRRSAG